MMQGWLDRLLSHRFGPGQLQTGIAIIFVTLSLLLGGGGGSAPMTELMLQLFAALTFVIWMLAGGINGGLAADRRIMVLAALVLALPALQLLPLPPAIWQNLPGREQQVAALELLGAAGRWMPWSQAPASTLAVLIALLPPLLATVMVARLDLAGRGRVIVAIAAVSGASLVLGALQLSAGSGGGWRFYGTENAGFLNGFHANRNAQADVVLIGMVAAATALLHWRKRLGERLADLVLAGIIAIFLLGCVLTGSRAGIALIPIALAAVACMRIARGVHLRRLMAIISAVILTGLAAIFVLRQTGPGARVLDRFALGTDFRWQLWEDTLAATGRSWPMGSGMGSFRPAFIAAERLEVVDPTRPVGAHNDYLELALEGGLLAIVLLIAALIWFGRMAYSAWTEGNTTERRQIVFAVAVFLIIALHSVVDYPMRSMALACLGGVAAGLVAKLPDRQNYGNAVQ